MTASDFEKINESKVNFDSIYDRADPRDYFANLGRLDYRIPQEAKPVFQQVLRGLAAARDIDAPTVLDVGCSYGVNAALLKYDLDLPDLYRHYTDPLLQNLKPEELIEIDRAIFDSHAAQDGTFVGLDAAANALAYAEEAGLLDETVSENLESAPPSEEAVELLSPADAIISTGCVGYVTEKSFERLVAAADSQASPWIASFVLRMFPYDPIVEAFDRRGMTTEKLEGVTFPQRQFADREERDRVLDTLSDLGRSPDGLEAEGYYHAEFYLSRPAEEAARLPLTELASALAPASAPTRRLLVANGQHRPDAPRADA